VQKDPDTPLSLPLTDADRLAEQCPPPSSSHAPQNLTTRAPDKPLAPEGLEDEDYELQAAIAASMGGEYSITQHWAAHPGPSSSQSGGGATHSARQPVPAPSLPNSFPPASPTREDTDSEDEDELDPVEASRRRNMRLLEQFRRAQGDATRELELDDFQRRRRQEQDNEEEQLRRAIAESEALAREEGHAPLDENVGEARAPLRAHSSTPRHPGVRVYDDEDEELQAALRASLENVPPGFVLPESPKIQPVPLPASTTPTTLATTNAAASTTAQAPVYAPSPAEDSSTDAETEAEMEEPKQPEVDVEEMRRRRLARFGG
jgi:Ataxin-3